MPRAAGTRFNILEGNPSKPGNAAGSGYILESLYYAGKEGDGGAEENQAGGEGPKCCEWLVFRLQ